MSGRLFFGALLILLGLGFFLDQAGVVDFWELLGTYWPLIIIAIGIIQLLTRTSYVGGLIIIGFGLLLQALTLGLIPSTVWSLILPLALIVIGIWLILNRFVGSSEVEYNPGEAISATAAFGGVNPKYNTSNFRGGSVTAVFGAAEVDLREAKLAPEGAKLDVNAVFGGVEIWVPPDWNIEISGLPIFGAWEDKTVQGSGGDGSGPMFRINAFVLFGGAEVKN